MLTSTFLKHTHYPHLLGIGPVGVEPSGKAQRPHAPEVRAGDGEAEVDVARGAELGHAGRRGCRGCSSRLLLLLLEMCGREEGRLVVEEGGGCGGARCVCSRSVSSCTKKSSGLQGKYTSDYSIAQVS